MDFTFCAYYPTALRAWDNSTCASNFANLVLSEFHGIPLHPPLIKGDFIGYKIPKLINLASSYEIWRTNIQVDD